MAARAGKRERGRGVRLDRSRERGCRLRKEIDEKQKIESERHRERPAPRLF